MDTGVRYFVCDGIAPSEQWRRHASNSAALLVVLSRRLLAGGDSRRRTRPGVPLAGLPLGM